MKNLTTSIVLTLVVVVAMVGAFSLGNSHGKTVASNSTVPAVLPNQQIILQNDVKEKQKAEKPRIIDDIKEQKTEPKPADTERVDTKQLAIEASKAIKSGECPAIKRLWYKLATLDDSYDHEARGNARLVISTLYHTGACVKEDNYAATLWAYTAYKANPEKKQTYIKALQAVTENLSEMEMEVIFRLGDECVRTGKFPPVA
jgi:hypothetical protein